MKTYSLHDNFSHITNPVVTIGTFDGVHRGHQAIIKRLNELATETLGESVVVTFEPHPRQVLSPADHSIKLINTHQKKAERLKAAGVQHLIIIPFNREFAKTPWQEFMQNFIIQKLHAKLLVIGYDHKFGKDRKGNISNLNELGKHYGIRVEEVSERFEGDTGISSTRIRKALMRGDVCLANQLLGYEYSITGDIVRGNRIGHTLGFPTANLSLADEYKLIAANGVYASRVEWRGKKWLGMSNIGLRPTISDSKFTVEVNIFDFDRDIYDESLTVSFIKRIRDEVKFESLDALRHQLQLDEIQTRKILTNDYL
ncbi:MAG: bifunctional riboflavin kinase/FAD synthetase [Bacteroidales bacterium]|nr:bifunctional riboflavin kinase/FAD synthetase [Bacteroidales bacterium]